jgi:AcrR family transcriptional regulator
MARLAVLTKELITDVALECFLKEGFEETTFKQIAKVLGVSQPAIYTYFKNKMDILAFGAMRSAATGWAFIESKVNPNEKAAKRMRQYLQANFEFFRVSRKDAFAISSIYWLGQSNPVLLSVYQAMQKASHDRFETLLLHISHERGQKLKNSAHLARIIQSCMIGELYKLMYEVKPTAVSSEKMFYESVDDFIESGF